MKKIRVIAILIALTAFVGCENPIMIRYLDRLMEDRHTRPTITTVYLQGGVVGIQYNQSLTATGSRTIIWGITSGGLPGGLTLSMSGEIYGIPNATGTFNFTVRAINNTGNDTQELSIVITDDSVALAITTTKLPIGMVGIPYSQTLQATGTTPITWDIIDWTLASSGLTISASGVISGTPTEVGTFNFTVRASDFTGFYFDEREFDIEILLPTPEHYFDISVSNNQVTITGFTGLGGSIVIPSNIQGFPVITIGDHAFEDNQLTSVVIPDSVTTIERRAFRGNQLTSIRIPDSVTSIGEDAFSFNQLTSVTIPDSVTSIGGQHAFASNQLTSVTIGNSVTYIGVGAFGGNQLTSVTIPDSVTSLSGFNNNQLTSITIPDSVISIREGAFQGNQLTSVTIPDSVISIGISAFAGRCCCIHGQLTSVVIGNGVTSIGNRAFEGNQLTSVTIGAGLTLTTGVHAPFSYGFEKAYNDGGRLAGTWTRPDTTSTVWTRQ